MSFWSAIAKPFEWLGKLFVDATEELPKIITVAELADKEVPTLLADFGTVLNDLEPVAAAAIADGEPVWTALEALALKAEAAVAASGENVEADEEALAEFQAFWAALKTTKFSTTTAAVKKLVVDYDTLKGSIQNAVVAVEAATK